MKLGDKSINALYLGNTAISKAYLGNNLVYAKSSLPYRELEYIESDGTQKIEIPEMVFTTSFGSFEMRIKFTKENTRQGMGASYAAGKYWGINENNRFALSTSSYMAASIDPFEWQLVKGSYTDGWTFSLTVQDTTITYKRSSGTNAYGTFYLFGFKTDTSNCEKCSAQLEYAQFLNTSGALVLDLVPVLDDDGVPCLYDKQAGGLYYSAVGNEFGYKLK